MSTTLHLPGLAHTVTDLAHSHCAFTAKVQKFPAMLDTLPGKPFRVIHYGVEGAVTDADLHVAIMSREEQNRLRGHDGSNTAKFFGDDADAGTPLYKEYNARLRKELAQRVGPTDLVLLPFGWGHAAAVDGQGFTLIESGIGYPTLYPPAPHKIFESYAWMHWHQGRADRSGGNYEWVIPNYFDTDDWQAVPEPDMNRVVFLGRISDVKGVPTIVELARHRPDLRFELCGQGDPTPYLSKELPNLVYVPPLAGRARSTYLANARAVLMPTVFTEPFGGVAVEAMLCGTPVLSVVYGAFTETIEDRVTGFRCHTLGDWLAALECAPTLDRGYIQRRAQGLYGFRPIAERYQRAFDQISDLKGRGFYTLRSVFGPAVSYKAKEATEDKWLTAQREEHKFHLHPENRPYERYKRARYAALMGINWENTEKRRILDVGAGPESLMLLYDVAPGSVALDPLPCTEEDKERYAAHGIQPVTSPAETWRWNGALFDEVWTYNCLQHVMNPQRIMENMKRWGHRVRLFEWLDAQLDEQHLHRFTAADFREAFADWTLEHEMTGVWRQGPHAQDNFYMGIWVKPK